MKSVKERIIDIFSVEAILKTMVNLVNIILKKEDGILLNYVYGFYEEYCFIVITI